jgi:hypothetical protein
MGFVVYGIADPISGRVFYVGQSSSLKRRCRQHGEEGADTVCALMVQDIRAAGQEPVFLVLEECATRRRALMAEVFWIDLFLSRGTALANAQAFDGYAARARRKHELAGAQDEGRIGLEALANGRPLREGRRWSRKEEAMMRRLLREGHSRLEVADRLERSVGAIEERMRRRSMAPRRQASEPLTDRV